MQYRYNKNYANIGKFTDMFAAPASPNAVAQFGNDFIDGFATGPLQTNTFPLTKDNDFNLMRERPYLERRQQSQRLLHHQDFYGAIPGGSPLVSFTNHLHALGFAAVTYD